jgi:hypothetical protein
MLESTHSATVAAWILQSESTGFEPLTGSPPPTTNAHQAFETLRGDGEHCSTVDLRL